LFFDTDCSIFKTHYKDCILIWLKGIQTSFLYILTNIKYSSYDHISKSQKNRAFIK
jgi:hypothetical protein